MHSIKINKHPPQNDGTTKNGLRSYIKSYGLLLKRVKWIVEPERTGFAKDDIHRYCAELTDPLAFQAGEVETVKKIEAQLDEILNKKTDWNGSPFTIKTIITSVGSTSGLITPQKNAIIQTFAGVGNRAGGVESEFITIPPTEDDQFDARVQVDKWENEFQSIYTNPSDGASLTVRFQPSENGQFEVSFQFEK